MIRTIVRNSLEQVPSVALFVRNMRDLLDQRQAARRTPWGFTLAGHEVMASGTFEPEETALVRELLQDADVLVNVGANVGYYCCHALSMNRPVIAVEPNARNLHFLLRNLRDNGWSQRAEVFPVALAAESDILTMWGGGTGASLVKGWAANPESLVTQVPVLSLDRILGSTLAGRRALILVDIEGAEYMMLQGAQSVLRNDPKPVWLVEITTTEHQPTGMNPHLRGTFETFFAAGYRAFVADREGTEVTKNLLQRVIAGTATLGSHNFVFRGD